MVFRVLVVCGGNTCRSPMGEAILREMICNGALNRYGDVSVESAGTAAAHGEPASANALAALKELGLHMSAHRSRPLNAEMANNADLILAMEQYHLDRVLELAPEAVDRARKLADHDISDPYMMSLDVYRRTRDEIKEALSRVVDELDRGGVD